MTHLQLALSSVVADRIGWTLIHFLWQGLLLAALLQAVLPLCRSAGTRHNWALTTLAAMCLAPVTTFFWLGGQGSSNVVSASGAVSQSMKMALGGLAPTSMPVSWTGWLVGFWLAGVVLLSMRALGGLVLAQRLRRDSCALSGELLQRCRSLQRRLGMTGPVQFLQTRRAAAPVMVGWLKPAIFIPVSAITGLSPQQLDALILHELAHIRRLDAFINLALVMAETVLFYHPAIWWVSRRIRIEREHCCDDFAVAQCGDAAIYVEALTSLAAGRAVPAFALSASGGALKDRVARLLGVPSRRSGFSPAAMAGALLLSVFIGTVATAQINAPAHEPNFEIRVVDENVGQGPAGDDRVRPTKPSKDMPAEFWLKRAGKIDGAELADAYVDLDHGKPVIEFRLTSKGADAFATMTRENIGHRLAIVVNGTVIMAATVEQPILGGHGQITSNFRTEAEANAVVAEMMGTNHPAKP